MFSHSGIFTYLFHFSLLTKCTAVCVHIYTPTHNSHTLVHSLLITKYFFFILFPNHPHSHPVLLILFFQIISNLSDKVVTSIKPSLMVCFDGIITFPLFKVPLHEKSILGSPAHASCVHMCARLWVHMLTPVGAQGEHKQFLLEPKFL